MFAPVTFIDMNALCPAKSSQKWCPNIVSVVLDQSRWLWEVVLQLKICISSEIQHLSVYVPDPSHFLEPEHFPNDHPKSCVGLYIDTSKHFELRSIIRIMTLISDKSASMSIIDILCKYHKNIHLPYSIFLYMQFGPTTDVIKLVFNNMNGPLLLQAVS